MPLKKKVIWIGGIFLLALATIGAMRLGAGKKKPAVKYETVKVDRGKITAKVTATGTLSALVTVQVGSQISGRIAEIMVDFNSPVKKGQVIARIDPQLFQAALAQARANDVAAKGNLTKAKVQAIDADRQYERSKRLMDRKLIAQADLDTAQAAADAAHAQVEALEGGVAQAKAALAQAQVNLAYATIYSPIDGVVISRSVDVGQTVAASLQAPVLFTIAQDLRKMQVDTSVAEADIGKLKDAMPATFTVDAYPGERFEGRVRQIRNAPTTVQNVVTYDAVIDVDNDDLRLKPGMTANCTFVYAEREDVLRAPNAALRFRPAAALLAQMLGPSEHTGRAARKPRGEEAAKRSTSLWVLRGDKPVRVAAHTGISDGSETELLETEVQPGDQLITDARTDAPPRFGGMPRMF